MVNNTEIEIADVTFQHNMGGGMVVTQGCTVKRIVVMRCTFYENHKYDLALAGYPTAYNSDSKSRIRTRMNNIE